jgi:hypothetical protein
MANRYSSEQICNIQANLYIIHKIYANTDCHQMFDGQKIYDVLKMSKDRYYRILSGKSFNITDDECVILANKFGIPKDCFNGKALIEFFGIQEVQWDVLFKERNGYVGEKDFNYIDNKNKIEAKLKNIRYRDILLYFSSLSAAYRIQFFFANGYKFEEQAISLNIKRVITDLEAIEFDEWGELETKALEEYSQIIHKQLEKIDALIIYKRCSNKK